MDDLIAPMDPLLCEAFSKILCQRGRFQQNVSLCVNPDINSKLPLFSLRKDASNDRILQVCKYTFQLKQIARFYRDFLGTYPNHERITDWVIQDEACPTWPTLIPFSPLPVTAPGFHGKDIYVEDK